MTPFIIGLTGSIGMGKSTTAGFFAAEGAEIWDADAAVHSLYARDGAAVAPVAALCPEAFENGAIRRDVLSKWVQADPANLKRLEAVVHPLVARDRARFLTGATADIVVLDIPLLLENGPSPDIDLIVVASAPPDLQRQRVLERPGMTPEKFALILSRQMPDAEKRARADVVIPTATLAEASQAVRVMVQDIRAGKYARDRARHRDHGL